MNKLQMSAVALITLAISAIMVATNSFTEPIISAGPLSISLVYILAYGSIIFLVWAWTPILEQIVKFFMNGTVMKIAFFIVLLTGIVGVIDLFVLPLFGVEFSIFGFLKKTLMVSGGA